MIGLIGLTTVGMVGYGFRTGHRMVADYSTLVEACAKVRLEASYARVQFDDLRASRRNVDVDTIEEHLNAADRYSREILIGLDSAGSRASIDNGPLRKHALEMYRHLTEFGLAINQQIGAGMSRQIDSESDQCIDRVFTSFVKQAEWVDRELLRLRARDMQMFLFTQIFLLLGCVVLTSFGGAVFHRFERGRAGALADVQKAMQSSLIEIDRRERVERDLRKSQHLVSRTVSRLRDAVLVMDAETNLIIDCNPAGAKIFGHDLEELAGAPSSILHVNAETAATFESLRDRAVGEWGFLHLPSFEMKRKNGDCFPVEHTAVPLEDDDGRRIGWVSVVRDITNRVLAEEQHANLQQQLHQWQKMQAVGQLASGVAHDFNNLLTAISGYVEHARRALPANHPAFESLDGVEDAVGQAAGVTRSLLTFSHQVPAEKTSVNLCELVNDSARLLRRVLPANITLDTDTDPEQSAWISADRTQIQQVLMNLAINARDAMPNGGALCVSVCREPQAGRFDSDEENRQPDLVRLSVSDTGEGMSPEVRQRIFEPFFTTKPVGHGTGLGLAIIHGIVQDHGGHIDVHSEVGRGSVVSISLPGIEHHDAAESGRQSPATRAGSGELILLAEDNHHVRGIIASTLDSFGYETLAVVDGETLLKRFAERREQTQLLVVDVDLPGRDGLDCLSEIRETGAQTPAIVITASADPDLEDKLDTSTVLLRKPFQISELSALAGSILEATRVAKGQCE